jgi:general secretion pathway protein A
MYTKFYGLKEKPFEITPDPRFLYLSDSHKEALAHLAFGVKERKGLIVITGEVGTGKTTLVRVILMLLDRRKDTSKTRTAYLFNPKLSAIDLLHYLCEDLMIKVEQPSKVEYLIQLNKFLTECYANDENVVLIIDEAQSLDLMFLEEIRLLTNLETSRGKLLQVILIGQPELSNLLDHPQSRSLKQRISLRYHLTPLNQEEMKGYIRKRLATAGAVNPDLFSPKALGRIYKFSKGIPRLINIACDNTLIRGYANDQKIIEDETVKEAIRHLEGAEFKNKHWLFRLPILRFFLRS